MPVGMLTVGMVLGRVVFMGGPFELVLLLLTFNSLAGIWFWIYLKKFVYISNSANVLFVRNIFFSKEIHIDNQHLEKVRFVSHLYRIELDGKTYYLTSTHEWAR